MTAGADAVTPDGHYLVVRSRLRCRANPSLPDAQQMTLVAELMAARRAVSVALRGKDAAALADARAKVDRAETDLGERGRCGRMIIGLLAVGVDTKYPILVGQGGSHGEVAAMRVESWFGKLASKVRSRGKKLIACASGRQQRIEKARQQLGVSALLGHRYTVGLEATSALAWGTEW